MDTDSGNSTIFATALKDMLKHKKNTPSQSQGATTTTIEAQIHPHSPAIPDFNTTTILREKDMAINISPPLHSHAEIALQTRKENMRLKDQLLEKNMYIFQNLKSDFTHLQKEQSRILMELGTAASIITKNAAAFHTLAKNKRKTCSARLQLALVTPVTLLILAGVSYQILKANASDTPSLKINKEYGTISSYLSDIHFNIKPFIAVKRINISFLLENIESINRKKLTLIDDIWGIDPTMPKYYSTTGESEGARDEMFRAKNHIIMNIEKTGTEFNETHSDFQAFMHDQKIRHPLAIEYFSPARDHISQQKALEHTPMLAIEHKPHKRDTSRQRRFIGPALAALLPVAKLIGPSIGTAILKQATSTIAEHGGIFNIIPKLVAKHHNYVQTPEKIISMPLDEEEPLIKEIKEGPWKRWKGSVHFYKTLLETDSHPLANVYKDSRQMWDIEMESDRYFRQRHDIMLQTKNLLKALDNVKKGKLTPYLLNHTEIENIIKHMDDIVRGNKLDLVHLGDAKSPATFYDYVTPFLILADEEILLFTIIPMVQKDNVMQLYHVKTVPFITMEKIVLELRIRDEYYATDEMGSQHALLSNEEYQKCVNIRESAVCHISRPLVSTRSLCYNAIHFGYATETLLLKHCQFDKADPTIPRFIYISPNRFAYYIPEQTLLHTICSSKDQLKSRMLPRSGVFSYPPRCHARIDQHLFYDTAIEYIPTDLLPPRNISSFLQIARGSWPALSQNTDAFDRLLTAATDNTHPEPLLTLQMRATILEAMKNLNILHTEQDKNAKLFDYLYKFITGLAIALSSTLVTALYLFCSRNMPEKRTFHRPKAFKNICNRNSAAITTLSKAPLSHGNYLFDINTRRSQHARDIQLMEQRRTKKIDPMNIVSERLID
jgi:hypothetical protein